VGDFSHWSLIFNGGSLSRHLEFFDKAEPVLLYEWLMGGFNFGM
jgi:hypothetical protein